MFIVLTEQSLVHPFKKTKVVVKKPTLKAIHICNSLQPKHKPKIAKEYVLANAENKQYGIKPVGNTVYN